MSRAAAVPGSMWRKVGRTDALTACMRAWWRGCVVAVLIMLSLVVLGEGAPSDLDPMSGRGGTVTTDFGGVDFAFALVLQPDGKLVAAGQAISDNADNPDPDFALARYLPDGRLDPTFGIGGKVITAFGGNEEALALVLQPDGKLVAAGATCPPHTCNLALARYLPDGRLDASFGVGGKVTTDFGGDSLFVALVLQPDGKLVAAGQLLVRGGNVDFALARYLPDGGLDPTFGNGGIVTTDLGGNDGAAALVLQPDGKLVVAGGVGEPVSGGSDFALVRYLPDGRLDPTFGTGGIVTTDFGNPAEGPRALALQPDGKLVVAGATCLLVACDFVLARYVSDGRLDASFGIGGKVITDSGNHDEATALALQPDGKLVAAGLSCPGNCDFALARYLPDGRLDPTFGTGGVVKVNALVTFDPIASTFSFTPDPTGCPEGFVGTFSFEARLTNISERSLTDLVVAVTTLTNGNLLHNGDGGPAGVGARLTVPRQDGFTDSVLSPDEFVNVPFIICLTQQQPFRFEVDVFGQED